MQLETVDQRFAERWWDRGRRLFRFLCAVWEQAGRDRLLVRASGLAYATLLAIVPLLAVGFALFTAFEAFGDLKDKVQDLLLGRLLPAGQEQVSHYIDTFVANSRDLSFVGFVALLITAVLLLDNIDFNFNQIWRVPGRRSLISRVTAYTSVLIFGTLLIGLSVTISARLEAAPLVGAALEVNLLQRLGSWLFPVASSALAFLLMFVIVPATRVRFASAAIGASFSAVTWELSKNLFAASVGQSVRYSTLYGSLAAVPIFLIWLYLTWILVLLGLEVAFTHQSYRSLVRRHEAAPLTCRERLTLALRTAILIARRFEAGETPPSEHELAAACEVDSSTLSATVAQLHEAGLVRWTDAESADHGLVPARPLDRISVSAVAAAVWGAAPSQSAAVGAPAEVGDGLVAAFERGGCQALGDLTLEEVVVGEAERPSADT